MFSDTHFHFKTMTEEWGLNGLETLTTLAQRDCKFALDIGTRSGDLQSREDIIEKTICQISDSKLADRARNFMYFSAGIWPDVESIHNREKCVSELKKSIEQVGTDPEQDTLHRKIIALGEFGLDHHWNPSGVDGRKEEDFDAQTYKGERELFEMQLELARELSLPAIIHSRDAFEDTLDCIKNVGYHNGIIHCYSYGLEEAKAFLDLGWYISFSGSITYNKKAKLEAAQELVRYVPEDRILCETDAPYLAPVPMRGQPNTPVFVEHTYNFVAQTRGQTSEELSNLVDKNIQNLFFGK